MQLIAKSREPKLRSGGGRSRLTIDPLVPSVGAVALFTYLVHGLDGKFTRDLGVYAYGARQVLDGQPPYVGIVNRAGPLAHLLPVPGIVAARVIGKDELVGMRVWYMLVAVACVVLAYVVVRGIFASRLAAVVAAATMLSFEGFISLAATGPREKTPMVLFMLAATWALSRRQWILTGVFISLATLTLQIALYPLLAATIVSVPMLCRARPVRALGLVVLGGGIPVAAILVYFTASGALDDLLNGFVLLNAKYNAGRSILERLDIIWPRMQEGYGLSLWLLFGGLVASVVLAGVGLRDRSRRRDPDTAMLVACTAATLGALAWTLVDFDSWVDAFPLLPFGAIGMGALIAELERVVSGAAARLIVGVAVVVPTALAVHFAAANGDDALIQQRATTRAVLRNVPGATIWSIEAPQTLVLAKTANPTRHQLFSEGLQDYVADSWPGGIDGFVEWNLDQRPELIAVGPDELGDGDWKNRIGPDYALVARTPGSVWFARRSLGERVLARIGESTHRTAR